jgi:hypothetical protein
VERDKQEAEIIVKEEQELNRIRNMPSSQEQERIYFELDGLISQVILNPNTRGLIVISPSSLGKTFRIKKNMSNFNKLPEKDYIIHSGHTTSMQFYIKCHNNRDKIHIFDDESILENKTNLNMVKAMLNGDYGIVEYDTSRKMPEGVSKKFIFTGKVIILLNELPRSNEHLKAVENRVLVYYLKMSRDEILASLYERAKREDILGTTKKERLELVDWIKDNTSHATLNLNYRLYEKVLHFFIQNKDNWKSLAKTQINKADEYTELVIQGLNQKEWSEQTGGHKSTYYRIKQRLEGSSRLSHATGISNE